MKRVRIGTVGYLNAWPLTARLDAWRYQVIHDHPAHVARMLEEGAVDVALAPIVSVLRMPNAHVVPGVCIGSLGPVHSVFLVGETPPEAWTEVRLDGASRTSAVLAKLLMGGPLSTGRAALPTFTPVDAGEAPSVAGGTVAALVIGDAARDLDPRFTVRIDLAEAWTAWTGLPFVFAVWAGGPGLARSVVRDLKRAAVDGLAAVPEEFEGADLDYLTRSIRYELDDAAIMGLRRFASLAFEAGLLPTDHVQMYAPDGTPHHDAGLDGLFDKVLEGRRLNPEEAVGLAGAPVEDLVAAAAVNRSRRRNSGTVSYCRVTDLAAEAVESLGVVTDAEAIRLVGAETLNLAQWVDLVGAARRQSQVHVMALRPIELYRLAGRAAVSCEEAARRLAVAGLTGLEPSAETGEQVLVALRSAHRAGLATTAVLRVDARCDAAQWVGWLARLRALQDETGGLLGFRAEVAVPLDTYVEPGANTAADYLRVISTARLFLDNVEHIQASWATQGPRVGQVALQAGCDDLGEIGAHPAYRNAASWTPDAALAERLIRAIGARPVRRDLRFQEVGEAVTKASRMRSDQPVGHPARSA